MILTMLAMNPEVPLELRRKYSPVIFGIIEARAFIDLQIKPWDARLDSLPNDLPVLIDATLYRDYPDPSRWRQGLVDLGNACLSLGHVAFSHNAVVRAGARWKDRVATWFDPVNTYQIICAHINRMRSTDQVW